jgi:NAD-dependent SIR2 family protein deacetylase
MFISPINNCPHIENSKIISPENIKYISFEKIICNTCLSNFYPLSLCLICGEIFCTYSHLSIHLNNLNHYLSISLEDLNVFCNLCEDKKTKNEKGQFILSKILNKHIQFLFERKYKIPFFNIYSKEEIFNIKYNEFISLFKNNFFKKIIFMVGAGISTTAGIPDFRSKTGLFKQLQEKYNMQSPEEFFEISTFLENPNFFYEFCKIFDLSKIKPTLTHKFISFLTKKNIVKYIFTQNIDGLELKAKINTEKIIFAHGTFSKGHCPQCKREIDIEEINKCINEGKIKYCDICNGPCKPKIVFYGEPLPEEFFQKGNDCFDADLIIIMGTSLQVHPFASLPIVTNQECWKVVFNMTNVGKFGYDFLSSNSLFLQGKTDQVVYNFIHDSGLENQFLEFLKIEYGEQEILIQEENIINVFDKKENDEKKNRDNKSNFENDFKNQDFNDTFNGSFDKEKNDMELEKM